MTLGMGALMDAAQSHALASGWFEQVNGHEPKAAPTTRGLSASMWVDDFGPVNSRSGLRTTTARVAISVRITTSMLAEPQDGIDPELLDAADALMRAYSGDFDLGGLVEQVDLLGAYGTPLSGRAGYLNQDGKLFRVFTLTLPLIIDDLWEQAR